MALIARNSIAAHCSRLMSVFGEKVVVVVPVVMPSAYALSIWLFVVSVNGFEDAGTAAAFMTFS